MNPILYLPEIVIFYVKKGLMLIIGLGIGYLWGWLARDWRTQKCCGKIKKDCACGKRTIR